MRTPSRSMPALSRKPSSRLALAVVTLILLVGIAALVLKYPLPMTVVLTSSVLLVAISAKRNGRRLRALASSRDGESICQFARSFDVRSTDTWVIRAVYEETQAELGSDHANLPLRASDRFTELGIDHDDLDMDLVPSVSDRTGRSLDNPKANPYFGKVETLADLVMFFNAQPLIERRSAR